MEKSTFSQKWNHRLNQCPLWVFWLLFTIVVVVINIPHFFDPPYWDTLLGAYGQANWLAHNNFNLFQYFSEPRFHLGGPRVYNFSLIPYYYGLFIYFQIPPAVTFFIHHLTTCLLAGAMLYVLFQLVALRLGRKWGLGASLFLLSCPLFISQATTFNMDLPLAAFSLFSLYNLDRKNYRAGLIWAILALFVKPSGAVIVAAGFTVVAVILWRQWVRSSQSFSEFFQECRRESPEFRALVGFALGLAFFLVQVVTIIQLLPKASETLVGFMVGVEGLLSFLGHVPDFKWVYLGTCIYAVVLLGATLYRGAKGLQDIEDDGATRKDKFPLFGLEWKLAVFLLGCFAFFLNVKYNLPRYYIIAYPVVVMAATFLLYRLRLQPAVAMTVLVAALSWNIANHYGRFHPHNLTSDGSILERTCEYHLDLDLHQRLVKYFDQNYDRDNTVLVTHWPFTHIFSIPELGYVDTPWEVYSNTPLTYAPVHHLAKLYRYSPRENRVYADTKKDVIWIYTNNVYCQTPIHFNPFTDEVVDVFENNRRKLYVFRRNKRDAFSKYGFTEVMKIIIEKHRKGGVQFQFLKKSKQSK